MKAEELRIGNIINHNYSWNNISEWSEWIVDGETIKLYNKKIYKPLNVTPEWLKRTGFEKLNNQWINGELVLDQITESKYILYITADWKIVITEVHHLQNVGFALTGKEIEVKELV